MASELKTVYLLSGSDRPKIARALERLRARVGEGALESLTAAEATGEDAVSACNARGLFGGTARLVLVSEVEKWKASDVKAVADYLGSPAPETVLALVGEGIRRDSALAKACAKAGDLLFFDVPRNKLPLWVGEQFKRLAARADAEACRMLVELVGDDLRALESEVEKLVAWADGEPIDVEAVELLAAGHADPSAFALTDSWGSRDVAGALRACETTLERARGSRRDELPRIVGRLSAHVARVRDCQAMAAEGVSAREAAGKLKKNPYYVQKLFAQAGNFSQGELDSVLVRIAQLDLAVKGGSRLPAELEVERALVEATRAAAVERTS